MQYVALPRRLPSVKDAQFSLVLTDMGPRMTLFDKDSQQSKFINSLLFAMRYHPDSSLFVEELPCTDKRTTINPNNPVPDLAHIVVSFCGSKESAMNVLAAVNEAASADDMDRSKSLPSAESTWSGLMPLAMFRVLESQIAGIQITATMFQRSSSKQRAEMIMQMLNPGKMAEQDYPYMTIDDVDIIGKLVPIAWGNWDKADERDWATMTPGNEIIHVNWNKLLRPAVSVSDEKPELRVNPVDFSSASAMVNQLTLAKYVQIARLYPSVLTADQVHKAIIDATRSCPSAGQGTNHPAGIYMRTEDSVRKTIGSDPTCIYAMKEIEKSAKSNPECALDMAIAAVLNMIECTVNRSIISRLVVISLGAMLPVSEGLNIYIQLEGPQGAGKSVASELVLQFMPPPSISKQSESSTAILVGDAIFNSRETHLAKGAFTFTLINDQPPINGWLVDLLKALLTEGVAMRDAAMMEAKLGRLSHVDRSVARNMVILTSTNHPLPEALFDRIINFCVDQKQTTMTLPTNAKNPLKSNILSKVMMVFHQIVMMIRISLISSEHLSRLAPSEVWVSGMINKRKKERESDRDVTRVKVLAIRKAVLQAGFHLIICKNDIYKKMTPMQRNLWCLMGVVTPETVAETMMIALPNLSKDMTNQYLRLFTDLARMVNINTLSGGFMQWTSGGKPSEFEKQVLAVSAAKYKMEPPIGSSGGAVWTSALQKMEGLKIVQLKTSTTVAINARFMSQFVALDRVEDTVKIMKILLKYRDLFTEITCVVNGANENMLIIPKDVLSWLCRMPVQTMESLMFSSNQSVHKNCATELYPLRDQGVWAHLVNAGGLLSPELNVDDDYVIVYGSVRNGAVFRPESGDSLQHQFRIPIKSLENPIVNEHPTVKLLRETPRWKDSPVKLEMVNGSISEIPLTVNIQGFISEGSEVPSLLSDIMDKTEWPHCTDHRIVIAVTALYTLFSRDHGAFYTCITDDHFTHNPQFGDFSTINWSLPTLAQDANTHSKNAATLLDRAAVVYWCALATKTVQNLSFYAKIRDTLTVNEDRIVPLWKSISKMSTSRVNIAMLELLVSTVKTFVGSFDVNGLVRDEEMDEWINKTRPHQHQQDALNLDLIIK